ncbi:MAG: hypothetical protein C0605_16110 [Hyphomicrobiales bacterium]|nr:MAG: hypothetical protein C0605_16110 [Hyphomicrobiales bacterium]
MTGKSTLMRSLMAQDILAGHGCALIDPHGDLALEVMEAVPSNHIRDVIVLDPSDLKYPVGFNPLYRVPKDERDAVAENLTATFAHLWRDSWGPRLEYILLNTISALLDAPDNLRPTMVSIPLMLVNEEYRERVLRHVQNPQVREYFYTEFSRWKGRHLDDRLGPIQNKICKFLTNTAVRNIFGQWKPSIDLDEIVARKQILIVRLSKGLVGELTANMVGSFVATGFQHAAMRQAKLPEGERPDFDLHIDEFHNFTTDAFADILSEARKYGLTLTIGHQYIDQMAEEVADAVFGNVGSIVSFRVSARDAERLAKEVGTYHPRIFGDLGVGEVVAKLLKQNNTSYSMRGRTEPDAVKIYGRSDSIRRLSRDRYGRKRSVVKKNISRWIGRQKM